MNTLLRWLLLLAPAGFRDRHGDELRDVCRTRLHATRPGVPRVWMALRELGGLVRAVALLRWSQARGTTTTTRGGGATVFDTTVQDLRFATRTLRRNPGYAMAAVSVLALGIGAATAIFSAANAFLFRPLPFADAERLVRIYETNPEFGWDYASAAPANVLDWKEQVGAFEDVAMYTDFVSRVTHVRDGEPELLGVSNVSGNFFDVLGVAPLLGRAFTWEETWEGRDDVVILSHGLWVSHFGADPGVIGRTLEFGTTRVEIVGVMPRGFSFPNQETQLWSPWGWDPEARTAPWFRRAHWVIPIARLTAGTSLTQADAELQAVVARLQTEYPETNRVMGAGLMPVRDFMVRNVRGLLYVLFGAVGILLLLACTNVANLTLVQAAGRSREVALRAALGAGRTRLARQLVTEGLVVAVAGGALGLTLGWVGIRAMAMKEGVDVGIKGATSLALDGRVALFAVVTSVLCGVLVTALPAIRGAGDVHDALKEGGRGVGPGARALRLVRSLVAVEVALAVLLVVGAGLMGRSFWTLRSVDPGFETENVLGIQFSIPSARYAERDLVLAFQDDFKRRLEARPGVSRVGIVGQLPLAGASWSSSFQAEGWPPDRVGFEILHRRADAEYFEALGIPLVRGRLFGPGDGPDAPLVVVINETFAREHFPGEDPIGQRIAYDRSPTPESVWYEIVGIVGDQLQDTPADPPRAEVFENRRQDWDRSAWYVVRTGGSGAGVLEAAKDVLKEMDPLIPVGRVRALQQVWRTSMARDEFVLFLLGIFGTIALILAAVGVWGVTAQAARWRTAEIGIRLALGAEASSVVGMMVRQGMGVVVLGLGAGALAALWAARAMGALLHGVQPGDPATFAGVIALLAGVAALASWLPARRAATVDPATSLRGD